MELTRSLYLCERAAGKSKKEIAESFGWFPHVLRRQLSVWGIRSAAEETAALEPLRQREVLMFVEEAPKMIRKPRGESLVTATKEEANTAHESSVRITSHCPRCGVSHPFALSPLTNGGLCEWWAMCEKEHQPVLVELKPTLR